MESNNFKDIKIYFIRHGETEENKKGRIQGRKDFPLNEKGKLQAKQAGQYLKEHNITFDAIYSSPLTRAYETASIIKDILKLDLNIQKEFAFIERDFGSSEGKIVSKENFIPILNDTAEGLEKSYEIQERVYNGLMAILDNTKCKSILIVSHSHVIKALLTKLDKNLPFSTPIVNCALNYFLYDGNNIQIIEYNIDPINE